MNGNESGSEFNNNKKIAAVLEGLFVTLFTVADLIKRSLTSI